MILLTWVKILAKRQLKSLFLIFLLILIPFITLFAYHLPKNNTPLNYQAGIYLDGKDSFAQDVASSLLADSKTISFILYSDLEQMTQDVSNNTIICAYIFPANLSEKVTSSNVKDCISVLMQSMATIQPAINELVYSEVLKLQGELIIQDYINSTQLFEYNDPIIMETLLKSYQTYTNSDDIFHINYISYSVEGYQQIESEFSGVTFPIRGILSILIFLSGLYGSVLWLKDSEKGIFQVFSKKKNQMAKLLYIAIPTCLFSISALISLAISQTYTHTLLEFTSLFIFNIIIYLFCYLFTFITKNSRNLISAIPILILACIIFCPIFINLGNYIPSVKIIEKLFIPYYYLHMFM